MILRLLIVAVLSLGGLFACGGDKKDDNAEKQTVSTPVKKVSAKPVVKPVNGDGFIEIESW